MSKISEYKSSLNKLALSFRKSRNRWKTKSKEAKKMIKYLKNKVKSLLKSRGKWKNRAKELEKKLKKVQAGGKSSSKKPSTDAPKPMKVDNGNGEVVERFIETPACHTYSVDHMFLFLMLVLDAATSLRGGSNVMEVVFFFLGSELRVPTWHTGRLWLLRLGYYKLTRPKDIANDWVWIVDHSVQIGTEKCFVILGVRLSSLESPGPLRHKDVEPIELKPVTQSNGEVVFQQLESATEKTGVPREIIADEGPDLKSGVRKFCEKHEKTCYIYDIKHKTALILKQELAKNSHWEEFKSLSASAKHALQQTSLAHLTPPNQKTKAKDMNVGNLVRWGEDMLAFLDRQEHEPNSEYDLEKINEKLGWVANFSGPIMEWKKILEITGQAESFVRHQGIYQGCDRDLERYFANDSNNTESAKAVCQQVIAFVKEESLKAQPGERLVGSSEVLESVFGKTKRIEKDQAKSGFTKLILSAAAMVSETTAEVITKAMENVPVKEVIKWGQEHLGESVQSRRKEEFGSHKNKEPKWGQILEGE